MNLTQEQVIELVEQLDQQIPRSIEPGSTPPGTSRHCAIPWDEDLTYHLLQALIDVRKFTDGPVFPELVLVNTDRSLRYQIHITLRIGRDYDTAIKEYNRK